jgi:glucokinase
LGGTKISTALVTREGAILARDYRQTLALEGKEAVIARMVAAARQMIAAKPEDAEIAAIGVGAPGPMDCAAGVLLEPPNLPGWENVPLKQVIEDTLGIKTFLENDANAAALAEHRYGAGQGTRNMIYITASTGIGGGLILDGQLYGGTNGAAGEVGHMAILPDGPLCGCGNRGHLEALASGPAMANAARELLANKVPTLITELVNGDADAITALTVEQAADRGDIEAERIISRAMEYMGIGMANLVNIFNPDMIVIGGGLSNLGDRMFIPLRRAVRRSAFLLPACTAQIVPAKLGADVGVLGAAVVAITQAG